MFIRIKCSNKDCWWFDKSGHKEWWKNPPPSMPATESKRKILWDAELNKAEVKN